MYQTNVDLCGIEECSINYRIVLTFQECVEVVKIFMGDNEKNNAEAGQFVQVQLLGIKDKNIYSRCVLSSIGRFFSSISCIL